MRSLALATVATALALSVGCTPASTFGADGYHHELLPYSVHYSSPPKKTFVSEDWKIDNYETAADGSPTQPKSGEHYRGTIRLDLGNQQYRTLSADYFDLRLENKRTAAVLWVQTRPADADDIERDLRVLVEEFAEQLAGANLYLEERDSTEKSRPVARERSFATKIVDGQNVKFQGRDAYVATIEIANVDQLKLDPNARSFIAKIMFVRTGYTRDLNDDVSDRPHHVPIFMRIGYGAGPAEFGPGLPDYEAFQKLIDLSPPPTTQTSAR
jgi:hypothetical protein